MQISSVGNLVSWIQIRIVLCSVLHGRKIYLQIKMNPCSDSCVCQRGTWTTVRYLETWTCSQNGVKTGFVFYFVSKHLTVVLFSMFYVAEIYLQNQFHWATCIIEFLRRKVGYCSVIVSVTWPFKRKWQLWSNPNSKVNHSVRNICHKRQYLLPENEW